MKDMMNGRIKVIIVLLLAAITVAYIYFVTPYFLTVANTMRAENKTIEYELAQMSNMGADQKTIEQDVEQTKKELNTFKKRTKINEGNFEEDLKAKAKDAGIELTEIEIGEKSIAGWYDYSGKVLYVLPLTLHISGDYKKGVDFIDSLESSDSGIYEINDFLYSSKAQEDSKIWMVNMELCYYGEEEN